MNPIHSEKYILSKESFGAFTIAQNKAGLDKNKRNLKITAIVQIVVGVLFIAAMMISKQEIGFIWILLAGAVIVSGFFGKKRIANYDKKVNETIEKSYNERQYGENTFKVEFFEDRLKYSIGSQVGKLPYKSFAASYDQENFYAMHFYSGEVIIFNPGCDIEKIKQILNDYKLEHPNEEYDPDEIQEQTYNDTDEDNQNTEQEYFETVEEYEQSLDKKSKVVIDVTEVSSADDDFENEEVSCEIENKE